MKKANVPRHCRLVLVYLDKFRTVACSCDRMILLKNKALDRRASFVSHKQPFAAFRDYKDYRSRPPTVLQEMFGWLLLR